MEVTEIRHGKLLLERGDDVVESMRGASGEDDIIDIHKKISKRGPTVQDEERRVAFGCGEPE